MTFMHGHFDALGAAFATTGLFVFLVLMLLKANDDAAAGLRATYQALRDADYTRLHNRFVAAAQASAARVQPIDDHVAYAEQCSADQPIPYMPVWTDGALPPDLDAQFEHLMHRAFIADTDKERS